MVTLADGRKVPAMMIKLDSVKVGKFTVQDVECCVLGPDAIDAPALLGMSFLGQFKFELDAEPGRAAARQSRFRRTDAERQGEG